jgi:hypothetical protein
MAASTLNPSNSLSIGASFVKRKSHQLDQTHRAKEGGYNSLRNLVVTLRSWVKFSMEDHSEIEVELWRLFTKSKQMNKDLLWRLFGNM